MVKKERIAKYLASAGFGSRVDAEKLILNGRVFINGTKLDNCATLIDGSEHIQIDGKIVTGKQEPRLWLYHKPRGLIVSHKDPQKRSNVFDNLPKSIPSNVISVGRLDIDSEGLLLITNSRDISRSMELPSSFYQRSYLVRVFGSVFQALLDELTKGITIDGIRYGAIIAKLERQSGKNAWISMKLHEGKNREIRNVLGGFGWQVNRLIRQSYGPFNLSNLKPGEAVEVSKQEVEQLFQDIQERTANSRKESTS